MFYASFTSNLETDVVKQRWAHVFHSEMIDLTENIDVT
jgi:hypothetical protein